MTRCTGVRPMLVALLGVVSLVEIPVNASAQDDVGGCGPFSTTAEAEALVDALPPFDQMHYDLFAETGSLELFWENGGAPPDFLMAFGLAFGAGWDSRNESDDFRALLESWAAGGSVSDPPGDAANSFGLQGDPDAATARAGGDDIRCVRVVRAPTSETQVDDLEALALGPQPVPSGPNEGTRLITGADSTLRERVSGADENLIYVAIHTAGDAFPSDPYICSHTVHLKVSGAETYVAATLTGDEDPKAGMNRAFAVELRPDGTAVTSFVAVDGENIVGSPSPGPVFAAVRDNLVLIAFPESEIDGLERWAVDVTCHHTDYFTERTHRDASSTDVVILSLGADATTTLGPVLVVETAADSGSEVEPGEAPDVADQAEDTPEIADEPVEPEPSSSGGSNEVAAPAAAAGTDDAGNALWWMLLIAGLAIGAAGAFLVLKRPYGEPEQPPTL